MEIENRARLKLVLSLVITIKEEIADVRTDEQFYEGNPDIDDLTAAATAAKFLQEKLEKLTEL